MLCLLTIISCQNKNAIPNEEQLLRSIEILLNQNSQNDLKTIVDSSLGVTILYSIAIQPQYIRLEYLDENFSNFRNTNLPYWILDEIQTLKYPDSIQLLRANKTIVKCEDVYRYGVFYELKNINVMSQNIDKLIMVRQNEGFEKDYLTELKNKKAFYQSIEENSIKIIVTYKSEIKNKEAFIFYFTLKENKWYLTVMDFYTLNCSV